MEENKGIVDRIVLGDDWNNNKTRPVKIWFKTERKFAVFTVEELKEILRLWIIGEEEKYPQEKGYRGRWMLFDEIKKVFDEKV
jgi:hypothetical protein